MMADDIAAVINQCLCSLPFQCGIVPFIQINGVAFNIRVHRKRAQIEGIQAVIHLCIIHCCYKSDLIGFGGKPCHNSGQITNLIHLAKIIMHIGKA